jgi:hypothetical protein
VGSTGRMSTVQDYSVSAQPGPALRKLATDFQNPSVLTIVFRLVADA